MAASDDSPISGPGPGEGAPVRRTPILTEATPRDEIEDAVEVPVTDAAKEASAPDAGAAEDPEVAREVASGEPEETLDMDLVAGDSLEEPAAETAAADAPEPGTATPDPAVLAAAAGVAAGAAAAAAASSSPSSSAASSAAPAASGPAAAAPPPAQGGSGFGRVVTVGVAAIIGGVVAIAAQPYLAPYLGGGSVDSAALNTLSARVTKLESGTLQMAANTRAIAALEAAVQAAPATPAAAPAAAPAAGAEVTSRLGELAGRVEALTGQGDVITRLSGELGAHAGDISAVKTRLETMATAVATASGDITALKDRLDTLAAADAATAEKVAGIQAALVAVDGRLGSVAGVAAGLQSRMETIEGTKGGALGDRNLAAVALALTAFAQDLQAGLPYAAPLATLKPVLLEPAPPAVVAAAATGLPTLPALRAAFEEKAGDLDIAVVRAEGGGDMVNRLMASARTLVRIRSTEPGDAPPPANPVEAIRAALSVGDLPKALAAAEALPPQTAPLLGDWTQQLKARVEASAFLTAVSSQFLARLSAGN